MLSLWLIAECYFIMNMLYHEIKIMKYQYNQSLFNIDVLSILFIFIISSNVFFCVNDRFCGRKWKANSCKSKVKYTRQHQKDIQKL